MVADAAVIGIPDEEWEQRVITFVQPREHMGSDEALARDLTEWCRAKPAT